MTERGGGDKGLHDLLARPADWDPGRPDLAAIRAEARRRARRRTSIALLAAASVVLAVAGAGLASQLPDEHRQADSKRADKAGSNGFMDERKLIRDREKLIRFALDEYPGARRIGDLGVLMPPSVDQGEIDRFDRASVMGPVARLGVQAYLPIASAGNRIPPWLQISNELVAADSPSSIAPLLVDRGPMLIGCTGRSGGPKSPCRTTTLLYEEGSVMGTYVGLGGRGYLQPGKPTQVFVIPTIADGKAQQLVVAGVGGVAERADVVTAEGRRLDVAVDADRVAPGATLAWTVLPEAPRRITFYRADGSVLDDHAVQACSGGVDCEVR